jgi:small subunit ribosomal protein S2
VDIPIPGNDDAMRAIELVVNSLCEGAMEGLQGRKDVAEVEADPSAAPRRGRRTAPGRAQEVAGAPPAKAAEAPPASPAPPAPGATA